MTAIWSGTVREFLNTQSKDLLTLFYANFQNIYNEEPDGAETRSWQSSICFLQLYLKDSSLHDYHLLAEVSMPAGFERVDFTLLGGSDAEPKGLILEMKQWSQCSPKNLHQGKFIKFSESMPAERHPIMQALGYAGKLSKFSTIGASIAWACCGILPNMNEDGISVLRTAMEFYEAKNWQLFGKEKVYELGNHIQEHLGPCVLTKDFIRSFEVSPYTQTREYIRFMVENHRLIENNMFVALAAEGFALTEEQDLLCGRINYALENYKRGGAQRVFLVQGGAGSGKTLVALTLFMRQAKMSRSVVLGLTGKWMKGNLKASLDEIESGLSLNILGVHDFGKKKLDGIELIVCDEAQRMNAKVINNVLQHAPIVVIFLDEKQQLKPQEDGSVTNFIKYCGKTHGIEKFYLKDALRCRGGVAYHNWIECMLDANVLTTQSIQWRKNYRFEIFTSFDAMKEALAHLHKQDNKRVALVASYTESEGSAKASWQAIINKRVGKLLMSGFNHYSQSNSEVFWMMRESEYISFWNKGDSNHLERAASIYGAQGFESDYVGLIWGRDYVYRGKAFELGNPSYCYDAALKLGQGWHPEAMRLLRNRYRIFLTRGLLGTFVYCEDEETANSLRTFIERAA